MPGFGLGLRPTGRRRSAGEAYAFADADAAAVAARMTATPNDTRKPLIDALVAALKTAGVWAKLDFLYVLAAHDAQAARLNWVADQFNATENNSPVFAADLGYSSPGSVHYLSTGFNASTAAGHFTQNDCHMSIWSLTELAINSFSDAGATNTNILARTATDTMAYRISSGSAASPANASSLGHFLVNRTGATAKEAFRNGVSLGTSTAASTALDDGVFRVLRTISLSPSGRQLAAMSLGAGLTAGEVTAFHAALEDYLAAVGAA